MGPLYTYFHSHSSSKLNLAPSKHFHVRHAPLNLLFKLNFLYNTFSNPIPLIPLVTLLWAAATNPQSPEQVLHQIQGALPALPVRHPIREEPEEPPLVSSWLQMTTLWLPCLPVLSLSLEACLPYCHQAPFPLCLFNPALLCTTTQIFPPCLRRGLLVPLVPLSSFSLLCPSPSFIFWICPRTCWNPI